MEQSPSREANWFAAIQEIPRIFGTRRFLTVLKSARHLSLSWANSIQSPQTPLTYWRSILIFWTPTKSNLQKVLLYVYNVNNCKRHPYTPKEIIKYMKESGHCTRSFSRANV